jgi:GNAT superfamily N-acetyltransferase
MTLRRLDGRAAAGHAAELQALHAEAYADPPYGFDAGLAALFDRQLRVQGRQPGFALAEARSGDFLVGYAFGAPLRPSTSWWREVTAPLPEDLARERPGRTFALADVVVRAAWRRQGIGADLHDLILRGREEERATAMVWPAAGPAQGAFRQWGWRKVARSRSPLPGGPVLDVLIRDLMAGRR